MAMADDVLDRIVWESPVFSLAGIDGYRLKFFPEGHLPKIIRLPPHPSLWLSYPSGLLGPKTMWFRFALFIDEEQETDITRVRASGAESSLVIRIFDRIQPGSSCTKVGVRILAISKYISDLQRSMGLLT